MTTDDSLTNLPASYLLGSVPAVITEAKSPSSQEAPGANLQIFPPNNGGNNWRGNQTLGGPTEGDGQQSMNQTASNWKGFFSISSYTQYFNVDTDIVLSRILSSLYPTSEDFFSKIDANPDLYGLIWISTTLIFVIASLGNCATYLMHKRSDSTASWTFDVSYVNVATCAIYGYALLVPLGFYFLLQYMGSNASLIRFWCLWGYSLFIFILSSVGTAVVTRADGRLALGRLGALCEQIQELNFQGYEVILVTSGAVGAGRQWLKYTRLVNSSFADLQKPQVELDGKACAAVGQNSHMALYDALFSQLDVTSAQLLVTDNDFRDANFRRQLNETVNSLLSLKVIPIFNENDAVSTRKAPYEFSCINSFGA